MTAPDIADKINTWARALLLAEHGVDVCNLQASMEYQVDDGMVACGCGWVEDIGQPPGTLLSPSTAASARPPVAADPIQSSLALIDSTAFYGPQDIQDRILDVLARLERGALWERAAVVAAAEAKQEFEQAYWRTHDAQKEGAADQRKARAMVICASQHDSMLKTEALAKIAKATLHNLRSILSGYQSVARGVYADYQAGGANR